MIRGSVRIFLAEVLILPTGLITAAFLGRMLGPSNYGLFALASMLVTWLEWASMSVFGRTTIKFVGEARDWESVGSLALRLHLGVGLCAALFFWAVSEPLAVLFREPGMAIFLRIYAVDIPIFSLANGYGAILAARGLFKAKARAIASRITVRLALILIFVGLGFSVSGAIVGMIGASLAQLMICRAHLKVPFFSRASISVKRYFGLAAPLFLYSLSLRVFRLDLVVLKILGGTAAQAGFYGTALNLSIPAALFSGAMQSPLLSTLMQEFKFGNLGKANTIAITSLRSVFWLIPFAFMTAGAAPEIVQLIFGSRFDNAAPLLAWLIFAPIGLHAIHTSSTVYIALNRPEWTYRLTLPMVPLAAAGHLILIPRMGTLGAAVVTASVALLGAVAAMIVAYSFLDARPSMRSVGASGCASSVAAFLALFWPASGLMVIVKVLVIMGVIIATLVAMGEFTRSELRTIRSLLPFGIHRERFDGGWK